MGKGKILVVEDDADVRLGYHVLLKGNGYDAVFAADSSSALSEVGKSPPDAIILDIGLPAGDGFVMMDRLRAIPALSMIPVVVVTARTADGNMDRALKAGARAYLQKPCDDSELLAIIEKLLGPAELHVARAF